MCPFLSSSRCLSLCCSFPSTSWRELTIPSPNLPNVTRSLKAVVELQRFARGFVARNRVAGRREAIALLRSACFGVVINIIDSYIREVWQLSRSTMLRKTAGWSVSLQNTDTSRLSRQPRVRNARLHRRKSAAFVTSLFLREMYIFASGIQSTGNPLDVFT